MNNSIRFKVKMLIVLTFCVFMTFSMLVYVLRLNDKCEGEVCFRLSTEYGREYFLYNLTGMSSEMRSTSTGGGKASTEGVWGGRRANREVLKVPQEFRLSSGSDAVRGVSSTQGYSVDERTMGTTEGMKSGEVYKERRKTMERFCRKYLKVGEIQKSKKVKLNHILIDEKHKVLYCYVPKVACTNWKRIFLVLTGKAQNISEVVNLPSSEVHAKNLFKSLQNYTIPDVEKIAEEYTKFIFVRHPFERLLSAYRNKLEQHYDSSKYFQARFGKYIIKNFRKNPSNVSLEKGDDVTFAEFVSYLLSREPSSYNEHWQRVTDLCHPCLLRYDFIGKYETLREDSSYLLRSLGMNVSFPLLAKPSTTGPQLKKYYNTLGKSAIYKLYNIYQMDFRLFGYDLFNVSDWSNNS